jgi:ADP-ribosylation factor-like protein 8
MDIALVGLQNSGKTSVLRVLSGAEYKIDSMPTSGFDKKRIKKNHITLKFWDMGGQPRYRSMWARYCRGVGVIIFVVDIQDTAAFKVAKEELHTLLSKPILEGIPLLVLGNKMDIYDNQSLGGLVEDLDLKRVLGREVSCYGTSSKDKTNLDAVLQWLLDRAAFICGSRRPFGLIDKLSNIESTAAFYQSRNFQNHPAIYPPRSKIQPWISWRSFQTAGEYLVCLIITLYLAYRLDEFADSEHGLNTVKKMPKDLLVALLTVSFFGSEKAYRMMNSSLVMLWTLIFIFGLQVLQATISISDEFSKQSNPPIPSLLPNFGDILKLPRLYPTGDTAAMGTAPYVPITDPPRVLYSEVVTDIATTMFEYILFPIVLAISMILLYL